MIEKSRTVSLFIDLKKAYDSVPRQALLYLLQKYGMAPTMLSAIKSLHANVTAAVKVGNSNSGNIKVTNGL